MAEARQVVKYTFVKINPAALAWPADGRLAAAREFTELLDARADAGTLLTYSTVGLRGDCDLLIWQAADTVDEIQRAESQRSEEHTSELQSLRHLVCRLLLEKKKNT